MSTLPKNNLSSSSSSLENLISSEINNSNNTVNNESVRQRGEKNTTETQSFTSRDTNIHLTRRSTSMSNNLLIFFLSILFLFFTIASTSVASFNSKSHHKIERDSLEILDEPYNLPSTTTTRSGTSSLKTELSSTSAASTTAAASSPIATNTAASEAVNLAQILTRASLNSLQRLDAGDFVECYLLTRLAKLKSPVNINFSPSNTTTDPQYVTVRKSALGFRYKPRRPGDVHEKPKFELTLEYGPQRTGAVMDSEATPRISINPEDNTDAGFVSWENEGKVYFENVILSSQWDTADYLCPTTGAVLSKILDLSLEYITVHPRYQPFEVYDVFTNEVILRSSSSDDFVWRMMSRMAKMYVDITPILIPPKRRVRLYVNGTESVQKMSAVEVVGLQEREGVVQFYQNFYQCAKALVTGDDSYFQILQQTIDAEVAAAEALNTTDRILQVDLSDIENGQDEFNQMEQTNELLLTQSAEEQLQDDSNLTAVATDFDVNNTEIVNLAPSASPTILYTSAAPSMTDLAKIQLAQQAAKEAAEKEEQAKEAAASAALQSLLSGDGTLMTSTLIPCFEDPQYHINSTVFLFLDGLTYFQVKLIAPYWEAIDIRESIPPPSQQPEGKGDFLDWFLVLILSAMLFFGVLLALNKMGCHVLGHKNRSNFVPDIETAETLDTDTDGYHHSIPSSMAGYSPKNGSSAPPRPTYERDVDDKRTSDGNEINLSSSNNGRSQKLRNPDHVLLPHLKQTSKVAVPHHIISRSDSDRSNQIL